MLRKIFALVVLIASTVTALAQSMKVYQNGQLKAICYISANDSLVFSEDFPFPDSGPGTDIDPDNHVTIDYGPMTTTKRIRYDFVELYHTSPEKVVFNNAETKSRITSGLSGEEYYRGDCMWLDGIYDATFLLPTVPETDTYEIRIGYTANDANGMCQIYFGSDPNSLPPFGIPCDFRLSGSSERTGWEADTQDPDFNDEVDRRMRGYGFMKAPAVPINNGVQTRSAGPRYVLRPNPNCLRCIIVREQLNAGTKYYLRLKSVLGGNYSLSLDYIEFCPKSVYNNQEIPEDKY